MPDKGKGGNAQIHGTVIGGSGMHGPAGAVSIKEGSGPGGDGGKVTLSAGDGVPFQSREESPRDAALRLLNALRAVSFRLPPYFIERQQERVFALSAAALLRYFAEWQDCLQHDWQTVEDQQAEAERYKRETGREPLHLLGGYWFPTLNGWQHENVDYRSATATEILLELAKWLASKCHYDDALAAVRSILPGCNGIAIGNYVEASLSPRSPLEVEFDDDVPDPCRNQALIDLFASKHGPCFSVIVSAENLGEQARRKLAIDYSRLRAELILEFPSRMAPFETRLPTQVRLHIEDIDSFEKVRDTREAEVGHLLGKNGRFERSEESIQRAIEAIIAEPFHKKDWGGETNDLYTSNIRICGVRLAAAFLLKGNGLRSKVMTIADCGKNGDQLVRLVKSPAQLFFVQFVGNIDEHLIQDLEGKIESLRHKGSRAWCCVISGQDTARLLHAYGKA